ncbi:MAG: hypothetical protein IJX22_03445 [Opitutales bacterium]|nr:hypothetical protein [Opitutales bacterium]
MKWFVVAFAIGCTSVFADEVKTQSVALKMISPAEVWPWVPQEVWEKPRPESEEEFFELYGIPKIGSKEVVSTAYDQARNFNRNFWGIVVDGEKFAVVSRRRMNMEDPPKNLIFNLRSSAGRRLRCFLKVAESEQESLDRYAERFWGDTTPRVFYIHCAERIPWGTFCRRIKVQGGFLDFVNGTLGCRLSIGGEIPVDLLPAGKEIDALFRGKSEFLPEDDPELVAIRKAYQDEQEKRAREWREELARREKAERAERL